MNGINTYPEMNETIKSFLKMRDDNISLYTLARIQELEAENERLKAGLARYQWRKIESEKDLPEKTGLYQVSFRDGNAIIALPAQFYPKDLENEAIWVLVHTSLVLKTVIAYAPLLPPFEG